MKKSTALVASLLLVAASAAFAQAQQQKKPVSTNAKKEAVMTQPKAGCPSGEFYNARDKKCEPKPRKR